MNTLITAADRRLISARNEVRSAAAEIALQLASHKGFWRANDLIYTARMYTDAVREYRRALQACIDAKIGLAKVPA
jgi:hypothetical protein